MKEGRYLVLGGSSGIGLAIALQLRRKGGEVTVVSRSRGSLPEGGGLRHIPLDVLREEMPAAALPDGLEGFAYCPGTINLRPFRQLKEEDFLEDFRTNVLGAVKGIQACLPLLRNASTETASILLFSTVAVQTGMAYHASAASAKGAVEGLTRSLAAELAPRIRVNCIAPSLTDTPLAERLLSSEEKRRNASERHPLKRFGTPRDIAAMACFLLGDESDWITGQIIHVDGGMSSVRLF